ncbi:MAG TPA: hypothetical protein PKI61_01705 [bacterium]|nr:hypothetical protein [bacterium]HPT30156.1 hypothetical protein [bacterium]
MKLRFWFIINLLLLASLELLIFKSAWFYALWIVINVLEIAGIYQLAKNAKAPRPWGRYFLLPLVFLNSILAYSILVPQNEFLGGLFTQLLFIIILWFNALYAQSLKKLWMGMGDSYSNLSALFSFLSLFFALAALYGLQLFLNLSYWVIIIIMAALVLLLAKQNFGFGPEKKQYWPFIILIVFIMVQLAWALYFLPFDYDSLGLILALLYYLLINIVKFYLERTLSAKTLKALLLFGGIIMVLLILTVRWR